MGSHGEQGAKGQNRAGTGAKEGGLTPPLRGLYCIYGVFMVGWAGGSAFSINALPNGRHTYLAYLFRKPINKCFTKWQAYLFGLPF